MPNRAQRRMIARKEKAIRKALILEDKSEANRIWFEQGYLSCRKAAYAAFAIGLKRMGLPTENIVASLRVLDERLMFYSGEEDLIEEAYKESGLLLDFDGIFPEERIMKREEDDNGNDRRDEGMAEDEYKDGTVEDER